MITGFSPSYKPDPTPLPRRRLKLFR
ncbi:mgtA regulatory leader peptide MgtL [Escherichia coli]|nr:mgtA regulatory leader peptide MgtL [Escherichia coli]